MSRFIDRLLIISGIIGPSSFFLGIIIIPMFLPGYNHQANYISELAAVDSPVALIASILIFFLMGMGMALYGIGLFRLIGVDWSGQIAGILLFSGGILFMLIAFFQCDAGCHNYSQTGYLHEFFSNSSLYIGGSSLLFLTIHSIRNITFPRYWSLITLGVLMNTIFFTAYYLYIETPGMGGMYQRLTIIPPFLYLMLNALYLYKKIIINRSLSPTHTKRSSYLLSISVSLLVIIPLLALTAKQAMH
ncbi:DUF998 domain-containing protein [candidate division WWE3 bacterium]|uniref:DUF998 domain-containing protein n=1 Tax=candidate division WWE3 bacterium TaxID=2053526 RepID=A0A955LGR6_UNCKA|nr:DUF998 domain-containing protein [candidate division WWE3 bacterium]